MTEFDDMLKALDKSTMVTITDADGKLLYVNELFCSVTKYSKDELIGAKPHELLNSGYHNQAFYDNIWNTIKNGHTWRGNVKNKKKDGSFFWALTTIMPFLDESGKPYKFIAIRKDITDQKQLEEQLAESLKQLEKAAKEKEELAAMIAHDLKQPLVPIRGNAEMLTNPKMGKLNEMQRESVEEIMLNSIKLGGQIEVLLTSFKLGAKALKFSIQKLSSKDVLDIIMKDHALIMKPKGIEYVNSSRDDFHIFADERRIREVFTNLVQNAVDFVPNQGGRIEIGAKDDGNFVQFHVKDNGIGIPKEKLDKLFEKYFQVKSSQSRRYGGTGLGLSVCHELVQNMKGKIWLESEEGKGTTCFFTIPKAG